MRGAYLYSCVEVGDDSSSIAGDDAAIASSSFDYSAIGGFDSVLSSLHVF